MSKPSSFAGCSAPTEMNFYHSKCLIQLWNFPPGFFRIKCRAHQEMPLGEAVKNLFISTHEWPDSTGPSRNSPGLKEGTLHLEHLHSPNSGLEEQKALILQDKNTPKP